jgi:hypothetical protein
MKIEFSNGELVALSKALTFVKFHCRDYDARQFAGSPLIGEAYRRIAEAAGEYYKSINISFFDEWPFIESVRDEHLEVIKVHIGHVDNWKDLPPDRCAEFIKTLVYPYRVTDETIDELKAYGDRIHALKT